MSTTEAPNTRIAYSPEEVAAMLGVSVAKITADLRSGKLEGIRIGRLWRIRTAALDAYLGGAAQSA